MPHYESERFPRRRPRRARFLVPAFAGLVLLVTTGSVTCVSTAESTTATCFEAVHRAASGVVRVQTRAMSRCFRREASVGADDRTTAAGCVAADENGSVAKATEKLGAAFSSSCVGAVLPSFGLTDARKVARHTVVSLAQLVTDVYGFSDSLARPSEFDGNTGVDLEAVRRCRIKVNRHLRTLARRRVAQFYSCVETGVGSGEIVDAEGWIDCLDFDAAGEGVPSGPVVRARARFLRGITDACPTSETADALAGVCSGLDGEVLVECLAARVDCRVCRALSTAGMVDSPCSACEVMNASPCDAGSPDGFCLLPCDQQGLMDYFESAACPTAPALYSFACSNQTISIAERTPEGEGWPSHLFGDCDGFVLSGLGKGITFELSPRCDARCVGECYAPNPLDPNPEQPTLRMVKTGRACSRRGECRPDGPNYELCSAGVGEEGRYPDSSCGACALALGPDLCPYCDPPSCVGCPNVDRGKALFVLGPDNDDVMIHDLTVAGFFDGIALEGRRTTIRAVRFDGNCDEGLSSTDGSVGIVVEDSSFQNGCDKCAQFSGLAADLDADPNSREHYSAMFSRTWWQDCKTPLRLTNSSASPVDGRFAVLDNLFTATDGGAGRCEGPNVTIDGVFEMTDSIVESCLKGLRIGATTQAFIHGSRFEGNAMRGLAVFRDAQVRVEDSVFDSNGGAAGVPLPLHGAVAIGPVNGNGVFGDFSPMLDLGDIEDLDDGRGEGLSIDGLSRPSSGRNVFGCFNRTPRNAPLSVQDLRGEGDPIPAEDGCWCFSDGSIEVLGRVDTVPAQDPFSPECWEQKR